MDVLEIILTVSLMLSLIAWVVSGIILCLDKEGKQDTVAKIFVVSGIMLMISLIAGSIFASAHEAKEFPASKYELGYRVTNIGDRTDTTYVVMRK